MAKSMAVSKLLIAIEELVDVKIAQAKVIAEHGTESPQASVARTHTLGKIEALEDALEDALRPRSNRMR